MKVWMDGWMDGWTDGQRMAGSKEETKVGRN